MESVFVTPSHHRVHHASNTKYLDKNMGLIFIIWDRIFGTFQREMTDAEYEPIRYGLTKPLNRYDPIQVVFHEWLEIHKDMKRKDLNLKQKFNYLFKRPGWSHCPPNSSREERHYRLNSEFTSRQSA
jgi:hypothetical protein